MQAGSSSQRSSPHAMPALRSLQNWPHDWNHRNPRGFLGLVVQCAGWGGTPARVKLHGKKREHGQNSCNFSLSSLDLVRSRYRVAIYCVQSRHAIRIGRYVAARPNVLQAANRGPTRGITLRPTQQPSRSRGLKPPIVRFSTKITSDRDIACNTLLCTSTRMGLLTHHGSGRDRLGHRDTHYSA
jgi:hypothetical protein